MVLWNSAKVKVQLRLAAARLRTSQEKKATLQKIARRDIATLLERKKVETARIKTESMINEDIHLELLEILELFCETLFARFGLIENTNGKEPDAGVSEAVIGIVYAAQRTEVKELQFIRESLMHRYGRDWSVSVMENHGNKVSARVRDKCTTSTPDPVLVDAYLGEIAKGYNVDWTPPPPLFSPSDSELALGAIDAELDAEEEEEDGDDNDDNDKGKPAPVKGKGTTAATVPPSILRNASSSTSNASPPPYFGSGTGGDSKQKEDDEDDPETALLKRFAALAGRKPGGV